MSLASIALMVTSFSEVASWERIAAFSIRVGIFIKPSISPSITQSFKVTTLGFLFRSIIPFHIPLKFWDASPVNSPPEDELVEEEDEEIEPEEELLEEVEIIPDDDELELLEEDEEEELIEPEDEEEELTDPDEEDEIFEPEDELLEEEDEEETEPEEEDDEVDEIFEPDDDEPTEPEDDDEPIEPEDEELELDELLLAKEQAFMDPKSPGIAEAIEGLPNPPDMPIPVGGVASNDVVRVPLNPEFWGNDNPSPVIVIATVLFPVPDLGYVSEELLLSASLAIATTTLPTALLPVLITPTRIPKLLSGPLEVLSVEIAFDMVAFVGKSWLILLLLLEVSSNPGTITKLVPLGGTKVKTFPITSPSVEILPLLAALALPTVAKAVPKSSTPGNISLAVVVIWIVPSG